MSRNFTFTPDQRAAFERTGLLRLPGFFPPAIFAPMADAVWTDMQARYGVRRDDPASWTIVRPFQFAPLIAAGVFDALGAPELHDLADRILGSGRWERPRHWGGTVLVTFPERAPWAGRTGWHFDLPGAGRPWPLPVLRMFTFLEPLAAGGGGTYCLAGSWRLAAAVAPGAVSSKRLRTRVNARYAFIGELAKARSEDLRAQVGVRHSVEGVEVWIEELTGEPGDAVLMHPLTMHAGSRNGRDRPRMMLAQSILATSGRREDVLSR